MKITAGPFTVEVTEKEALRLTFIYGTHQSVEMGTDRGNDATMHSFYVRELEEKKE